jgi:glucan phosphoethanolaminetransferase (alkaline phosphatase superfamily)
MRYYRPPSVGFTGLTLVILSLLALMSAPFLVVLQQMNGNTSYIPGLDPKIAGAVQVGSSIIFGILAIFLLRGHNWARWGYLLLGAALLGAAAKYFISPWQAPFAVLYLAFASTLFHSKANEFFRLLKQSED